MTRERIRIEGVGRAAARALLATAAVSRTAAAAVAGYARYRRDRRMLLSLDDRQLHDIGIRHDDLLGMRYRRSGQPRGRGA